MDVSALLQKYNQPVPRYTSYPTAVHFNNEIPQKHYAELLASLNTRESVSLYVHIPFCHVLCHYCGCHTKVVNSYSPVKAYVETLIKEIHLVGKKLNSSPPVSQLHFGGGSPNFLEEDDIADIISTLRQYFDFGRNPEIAIETDPRLMSEKKVETLAKLGITRVSLGVQDFDPDVQKVVNRIQSFESVQKTVLNLRETGINKINFDLMIGLPLQTLETVQRSVEQAVSLKPNRLAVFAYAHVPWMKKHQKLLEQYPMPDTRLRFDMMTNTKKFLESEKYHAIGIDHFAHETDSLYKAYKNKTLHRNFQGYTDDQAQTIIGFGLSSISMFKEAYVQNMADAPTYRQAVENKQFPIMRGCILSNEDQIRRDMIEKFMCGQKINISAYPEALEKMKVLEQDNIVHLDKKHVQINSEGWPFARIAAACLDAYYQPQERQHARAI